MQEVVRLKITSLKKLLKLFASYKNITQLFNPHCLSILIILTKLIMHALLLAQDFKTLKLKHSKSINLKYSESCNLYNNDIPLILVYK